MTEIQQTATPQTAITQPDPLTEQISQRLTASQQAKAVAIEDIIAARAAGDLHQLSQHLLAMLDGLSPDDLSQLSKALLKGESAQTEKRRQKADQQLRQDWRDGGYPYQNRLSRKSYEQQKYHLQVELLKLQRWVKATGQRVVILFEGRDAAGKGGTIKRFMEHLNPRGARVVALQKPSEAHPLKQWKLSPVDLASLDKWEQYTKAKEAMFACTDTSYAPWTVIKSDCKKRARLNAMRYVLQRLPYENKDAAVVGAPDQLLVGRANVIFEQGEHGFPLETPI